MTEPEEDDNDDTDYFILGCITAVGIGILGVFFTAIIIHLGA